MLPSLKVLDFAKFLKVVEGLLVLPRESIMILILCLVSQELDRCLDVFLLDIDLLGKLLLVVFLDVLLLKQLELLRHRIHFLFLSLLQVPGPNITLHLFLLGVLSLLLGIHVWVSFGLLLDLDLDDVLFLLFE